MSVDAELAGLRSRLLLGRGSGASAAEVERHTRDREVLGGRLTVLELQRVQQQAQRTRGEAPVPTTIRASLVARPPEHRLVAAALAALTLGAALRKALFGGGAPRDRTRRDGRA